MQRAATYNRLLVVEDDPEIRELLRFNLSRAGFEVWEAESAEAALVHLDGALPALILLDWMLPGMSGVDLAKRLRDDQHTAQIPMLMLTARSAEADLLRSFDSGLDDYLTKPFSPKELIARIKSLLRRAGQPSDAVVRDDGIELDLNAHQLKIHGTVVHIGPTEFRLLELFISHPDRAFDRATLLDRVWGRGVYVEERTVDVHVLRLRRVLKPHGFENRIQTVRGVGYRYTT